MRLSRWFVSLVLASSTALTGPTGIAADKPAAKTEPAKPAAKSEPAKPAAKSEPAAKPAGPSPAEMKVMLEKMAALMSPTEHHRRLDVFVGSWNLTTRIYMEGPGKPPIENKGTAEFRWVLDGRFLLEEVRSEWAMPDPKDMSRLVKIPYSGMGMTGYDNFKNMYVASWADTMSTQLLTMSGAVDPDGRTFTYYGLMDEPMLNVIGRSVRYVHKSIDKDHCVFEVYDLHAGPDYKVIEMIYVRK